MTVCNLLSVVVDVLIKSFTAHPNNQTISIVFILRNIWTLKVLFKAMNAVQCLDKE